jgi:hypothetical protein
MTKEMKRFIREAEDVGWRVEPTRSGHLAFYSPDGQNVIHTGSTPQDWRTYRNLRAEIQRYCGKRVAFG